MVFKSVHPAVLGGVHHVTAVAGDLDACVRFYVGTLGLRLVKRTVNYDEPSSWHLYFGDEAGTPGSILTFFPHPGAAPGRRGTGEACEIAFAAPLGSLGYWSERLSKAGVETEDVMRFGEPALGFRDRDGLALEIVERPLAGKPWRDGAVPAEHALTAIEGVALALDDIDATERLLSAHFGYGRADVESDGAGDRVRLIHAAGGAGAHVDLLLRDGDAHGRTGAGSIHHVAFRARDEAAQADAAAALAAEGVGVTAVRDRNYFRSVYFREPGGVLFEIATDGPGFGVDESDAALGTALRLPPWLEARRAEIERALPPLDVEAAVGR